MKKKSTNEACLINSGENKSKRARGKTKIMQNNSSSHNFVNSSIKKASNQIDRNNLNNFNSYGQSCKFKTIFTVIF